MKRRILSAIICLALVFSLVPAGALASEEEISVDNYAVILQSHYYEMTDTAYVKLGFTDNSQKVYPVGKTYIKNSSNTNSKDNEPNRPQDFKNNYHFGKIVKYSIMADGTVDLSGNDFAAIENGEALSKIVTDQEGANVTYKYIYKDADGFEHVVTNKYDAEEDWTYVDTREDWVSYGYGDVGIENGRFKTGYSSYYGLNEDTTIFLLYGNPCYVGAGVQDADDETYAPVSFRTCKLSEIHDFVPAAIPNLYIGSMMQNQPVISYALNSKTAISKYLVAGAMTIGEIPETRRLEYKETKSLAYVVKATQHYNNATDKYYAELTLINETGLFTARTIDDVTDAYGNKALRDGVIGDISDPSKATCRFTSGSFVRYDLNDDSDITVIHNEGCEIEDIRNYYNPNYYNSPGFYLVNVVSSRNGILTFFNTDCGIEDVKNARAISCEFHEDGYDVIGIDDNQYIGETLTKISSRTTELYANLGNAIIEVDEGQIIRVFSFVDGYELSYGGGGSGDNDFSDNTINPDDIYIDEMYGFNYGAITSYNATKKTLALTGVGTVSFEDCEIKGDIAVDDAVVYYCENGKLVIEKVEIIQGAVESFTEHGVMIGGKEYFAWADCAEIDYGDIFQFYMDNKSAMGANTKYYVYNNLILEIHYEEAVGSAEDYAVITRSYYDSDMDTAYVKLAFADNTEGTYQVGKTYLKNTREPNSYANEGNRPQDFANNYLFGIVVRYEIMDNGSVDLSGQDFAEILWGSSTTKYYNEAYNMRVCNGNLNGYYGINDDTVIFVLYGNPCYGWDNEDLRPNPTEEGYAPVKAKAYKLNELVDMQANAIPNLYIGYMYWSDPIVSYVLNSKTDINKYIVCAAMTVGENLYSGNIAYKDSSEFAYVVKATQYYNVKTDKYYAELTLINENGLFKARTIENVTDFNAVEILDNGVIGDISDPSNWNCKFERGAFVCYKMNAEGLITALDNIGCELRDIETEYTPGVNPGFYLVNVYEEHNGMLRFFNTAENIDDIHDASLQTVAYHEDGCEIIGIGNNTYVGSKLATLPSSKTSLEADCGNAIIEIDEGYIVRVFSFNNGYWCEGMIVPEYYSITYDANGGMFTVSEQSADVGEALDITEETPVMQGYTFEGWATKPDATNVEYHPGERYVGTDITLYAIWSPNTYELKYLVDGEEYKSYEYDYLDEIIAEEAPVKTGYAFSGWFGAPEKMPSKNVTVTGGFVALNDKTCGDNLTWSISSKGVLTISGSGAMEDYDLVSSFAPWSPYREKITSVVVESGVSYIGDYAFFGCGKIESIKIPDSVADVGLDILSSGKDITVYGNRGGFAEDFAEENGYTFVVPTVATGITLNKAAIELETGEIFELVATVLPEDAMDKSVAWSYSNGKIAKVDENGKVTAVAIGTATITARTADGKYSATCDVTVIDNPSIEAKFTLSDETALPGDIIDVRLSLKSNTELNSIALSDVGFDENVLEFIGFSDYEHLDDMCAMPIEYFVDNENIIIAVPLSASQVFSGDICTLQFKVKATVSDCTTAITAKGTAKNNADVLNSVVAPASIIIRTQLPGDIDGDGTVNIKDAVRLFQHSMLPDVYQIAYVGDLDFTKDGVVDINDAVRLFQYSMLPDVYPID